MQPLSYRGVRSREFVCFKKLFKGVLKMAINHVKVINRKALV